MMKYYHATPLRDLSSVRKRGLVLPSSGRTSGSRKYPGIYLYKDFSEARDHYLGLEELGVLPVKAPKVAVLEVEIPPGYKIYQDPEYLEGSVIVDREIPPQYLKVIYKES